MADMLNVFDLNRRKTAILQNAYNITETHELNNIYTLSFQIPNTDDKVQYIQPFHYVRYGNNGELYRIVKTDLSDGETAILKVDCEHVIATLVDDIMFGVFEFGDGHVSTTGQPINVYYTENCIRDLLNQQKKANWTLDKCDFKYYYQYLWEQENILNALYSVPKCFVSPYKWTFDTQSYPWKISLKKIDTTIRPEYYIRAKRNLLSSGTAQDFADICTRLYPLGYGEGVNQLTIKDVNGGKAYLEASASAIEKYGIKEKVLVDRQFEDAETLKAYAQTVLDALQTPSMSRSFDVTDLYPLTNDSIDHVEVGDVCKLTMDDTIAYVTKTVRVLDQAGNLTIELSTKATDVVSSIADLADRVRIEQVYSQGATQLYQHSKDANATPEKGMVMSLYFPSEMRQINKVLLRLKLNKFRSYSQATDSADITIDTNSTELKNLTTTESGGGTTASGGGTSVTVGGGSTTNQKTAKTSVSIDVEASGVSYAPQEEITSAPNTELTSSTIWAGDERTTTTEGTTNGVISLAGVFNDNKLYGGTYSLWSDDDGKHSHSFMGGYGEITVTGGSHHHDVSVNVPVENTIPVRNNLTYYNQDWHAHDIVFNALAHSHNINHYHKVNVSGSASGGNHQHTFSIPNHTHTITAHTHKLPDLSHSHKITFKGHSHNITAGIFESGKPTGFDIYVSGKYQTTISKTSYNGDITTWLLNESKLIPRDSWIDVEIRPNDLAYVVSSVFVQGFVQSRGGGNY